MLTEISPFHLSVLQFCIGIVILMYSGDRFVALACQLARALATPTLFIGTLVVAFATSIPEILVTLIATQQGNSDIAVGNALGSYISNIALVVGFTAVVKPLSISMEVLRKELPVLAVALACAIFLVTDGHLSQLDGAILIVLFIAFLVFTIMYMLNNTKTLEPILNKDVNLPKNLPIVIVMFTFHLFLLLVSSYVIVDAATNIADILKISQMVIGLTVVAIGTSLPELTTTLFGVWRDEDDLAIGNIIGSNIFCLLFILGLAVACTPNGISTEKLWPQFIIMILTTTSLWLFSAKFDKVCQINRIEGSVLLAIFALYLATITI